MLAAMEFIDALRHFGSRNKIAKALGINRQAITRWAEAGIPLMRQYQLEELTGGKLKRNGIKRKRGPSNDR